MNDRPRCAATAKTTGRPCGRSPVPGATVCRYHGGLAPQVQAAARRRVLAAEAAVELAHLGVSIDTTPVEALEAMLAEAAGNVVVLRELVAGLRLRSDQVTELEDDDGTLAVITFGGAIAGQVRADSAEAKPHVFVVMYNDERDRLAALAVACAKLGIDERRLRLAEIQTTRLFNAVQRSLEAAGLSVEQRDTFSVALAGELRDSA